MIQTLPTMPLQGTTSYCPAPLFVMRLSDLAGLENSSVLRCHFQETTEALYAPGHQNAGRNSQHRRLNDNRSTDMIMISAKGGSTARLSAAGTVAGDEGQHVKVTWWVYPEAGQIAGATLTQINALNTELVLPTMSHPGTVHVILQAEDDGTPYEPGRKPRPRTLPGSGKGWCRLADTPQAHCAMDLRWFEDTGLVDPEALQLAVRNACWSELPGAEQARGLV